MRCRRQLGREHRSWLPDACIRRQRLARLARPPRQHRECELCLDGRRRCGERIGPALLGTHVLVQRKRSSSAVAARAVAAICEINDKPDLRLHLSPAEGKPRDVVGPILDMLFPPGTPARIPMARVEARQVPGQDGAPIPARFYVPAGLPVAQPAPKTASAANPLSFSRLTLTPRRPSAGHVLGSRVVVMKRGARLKTGHVFCSARFRGRPLNVLTRSLRAGSAVCAWRLPGEARGSLVSATVIVEQGRLRAEAPFRTRIS